MSPGGYALDLQGRLRQMVCVKGHRRRCQDFQAQFLRLGSEGKRYSLQLSDGSGAEADASISSSPSVNNTPSLYCVERITAFSVSCAFPTARSFRFQFALTGWSSLAEGAQDPQHTNT